MHTPELTYEAPLLLDPLQLGHHSSVPTIQAILVSSTDTSNDICMESASTAFSSQNFASVKLYLVSYGPRYTCSKVAGGKPERIGSIWSSTYGLAKLTELLREDCIDTSAIKDHSSR